MNYRALVAAASLAICSGVGFAGELSPGHGALSAVRPYSNWLKGMQERERGPFERLRWFCHDGSIFEPKPYACSGHGGGRQHGQYSAETIKLRDAGYLVANLLVELPPTAALANNAEQLKWALVERFLVATQDGWIFRRARFYRGAIQFEDEAAAAESILSAMVAQPQFLDTHYLLVREAARLLPWQKNNLFAAEARGLASVIAESDAGFVNLRNKVHGSPEPADIAAIMRYRAGVEDAAGQGKLDQLIAALEQLFAPVDLAASLDALAVRVGADLSPAIFDLAKRWRLANTPESQLRVASQSLKQLRDLLPKVPVRRRLTVLAASLEAEQAAFVSGRALLPLAQGQSRRWHLTRLRDNLASIFGLGFINNREYAAQLSQLQSLQSSVIDSAVTLQQYRETLDYLARAAGWADARLSFHLAPVINRLGQIEAGALGYIPDRLRGSPMLLYGQLLDILVADGDQMAGIRHELFGRQVALGLRALNPGLARGPLRALETLAPGAIQNPPIVLASETTADLPAVAGILTARAGNSLSHVQLLARNLGIPNVVVGGSLMPVVESYLNKSVVLLASPGGVVRLVEDGPHYDGLFSSAGKQTDTVKPVAIELDLAKLDLLRRDLIDLKQLRAKDSGRIVGPKAAKLGELKALFPEQVSAGLALPFGVFRAMLELPYQVDGPSTFDWMRSSYALLAGIDNEELRQYETSRFLAKLRTWIEAVDLGPEFRSQLETRMEQVFGREPNNYGVFVRSDTNVEDLPGFTGAGLNLTLPNVSGIDSVLSAIKQVWASPFTERAFGWRQALMDTPEHVYAAVLLHKSVPADKSGVMVTADLTTGSSKYLSVAVNEGVSGGVDGQAAESVRIDVATGTVELLESAAESLKRMLPTSGGIRVEPASGAATVLRAQEIGKLIAFAREIPERYPKLTDAQGNVAPADVEFAFVGGQLSLIQIRPFLQSARAQRSKALAALDEELAASADKQVDLTAPPTLAAIAALQ